MRCNRCQNDLGRTDTKETLYSSKALGYYAQCKHINLDLVTIREGCAEFEAFEDGEHARKALKEMGEV